MLRLPKRPTLNVARCVMAAVATVVGLCGSGSAVEAQRIDNQVAVFAALDKVTARISRLEIKLGESVKFGALKITPRVCYSRTPDLPPKTTTFVEVLETQLDSSDKKLFAGWMFAESPGLGAVEHPVYDVWLTECREPRVVQGRPATASATPPQKGGGNAPSSGSNANAAQPPAAPGAGPAAGEDDGRRRRPPR